MALASIYNIPDWTSQGQETIYDVNDIIKYNNFYYYSKVRHAHGTVFPSSQWNGTITYNSSTYQYFFFVPSYNSKITIKPSVKRVQFGDGYSSISNDGINNILLPFDLTFDKRTDAEARAILHFLNLHAGSRRFIFTPPPPFNINKLFICSTWEHSQVFVNNNTVSAKFEEMVI